MHAQTKTRFKKTPIGEIPEDWEVVRIKDIAKIRGNKRIKGTNRVALIPMELIPDSRIFADYRVVPIEQVKSSTYCEAGDILLAKITPSLENGKQGIVPFDVPNGFALATTEVFPIAPEEDKIDRFFLFYLLKFSKFRQKIIASMTGTTGRQRASKKAVENLLIPLPPLPEQRKIAEILRTVDEAIERTDSAIERTERLKKGLMQRLLTRGIKHERFKKTELGEIPEEWEAVRLGDIAELKSGGTPSRKKPEYWENGTIPWVKSGELNDGIIYETEEKITELAVKKSSIKMFPKGTLLIALYGATVGKTAILGIDATTNQAICAILPKKEPFDPKFLQYYIIHSRNRLISQSRGGAQPNIYLYVLKEFKIPLPPLPEQKQIAEILSTVDRKLELLRKRREKLERIKRGLMKDLLTGRRRVRVE